MEVKLRGELYVTDYCINCRHPYLRSKDLKVEYRNCGNCADYSWRKIELDQQKKEVKYGEERFI